MKIAIMQPYLFPYIGYWQLINAVNKFVILDDVNFIKRGYINRNSILINGRAYLFTVPIKSVSQNRMIKDTRLDFTEKEKRKFLLRIENAYKKASQYYAVMPLIEDIIKNPTDILTDYIQYSIEKIVEYLHIETQIYRSSDIEKNNSLKSQDRIIEICKCLNGDVYINPSGGRALYQQEIFCRNNLQLLFLDSKLEKIQYKQFSQMFISNLSIIDILMFNEKDTVSDFLEEYSLSEC